MKKVVLRECDLGQITDRVLMFYQLTDRVYKWCSTTLGSEYVGGWWFQHSYSDVDGMKSYFYFDKEEDYVLCKLTWTQS